MDPAFVADGAGLGCNTIVVAVFDAGACVRRPAGRKTVRVIFRCYSYRRAVAANFGHLGPCREARAALGRAGRSVPRERQSGKRKTRARTHRFSPRYQGFGREWGLALTCAGWHEATGRHRGGSTDTARTLKHLEFFLVDYLHRPRRKLTLLILAKTGGKALGSFVSLLSTNYAYRKENRFDSKARQVSFCRSTPIPRTTGVLTPRLRLPSPSPGRTPLVVRARCPIAATASSRSPYGA